MIGITEKNGSQWNGSHVNFGFIAGNEKERTHGITTGVLWQSAVHEHGEDAHSRVSMQRP